MNTFSSRLKYWREKKKSKDPKWTQGYVADLIGVARPTYTAYENENHPKQPPLETVNKLADYLETSADYLLGRTEDPSPTRTEEDELDRQVREMMNDPETGVFFKDYLSAPEEKRREMRSFMRYLLQEEKGRKPGNKQGE